jgi:uncharacterized surface protein with fasciclin (FAS1) repeats
VFSGEISKALLDCVLCYCDTIALKTPKSREKNEGRRFFDYCGITTTEYKWTTSNLARALIILLFLSAATCIASAQDNGTKNIVDVAKDNGDFTTLLTALNAQT